MLCYECSDIVLSEGSLGCSTCGAWAHTKCVHLDKVPKKELKMVNWICTTCMDTLKSYLREGKSISNKLDVLQKNIEEKIQEVDNKVVSVKDSLIHNLGQLEMWFLISKQNMKGIRLL